MEQEVWKSIPGTAGDYEISNLGRVRSWKMGNKKRRAETPVVRKLKKQKNRPPLLVYSVDGCYYEKRMNTLMLEMFVGPRPDEARYVGSYKDGNVENNAASNLEWSRR